MCVLLMNRKLIKILLAVFIW